VAITPCFKSINYYTPLAEIGTPHIKHNALISNQINLCNQKSESQLGDGSTVSSRQFAVSVIQDGALANKTVTQIAAGYYHTLVIDSSFKVYAFGSNVYGQLGDGTTTTRNAPVAVYTAGALLNKNITSIKAGNYHSLLLSSDGHVYSFGSNGTVNQSKHHVTLLLIVFFVFLDFGQIGDNTYTSRTLPTAVQGALATKTVIAIAAGGYHSVALTSSGQVYSWGMNVSMNVQVK